ncbi:hypothetical protein EDC96DRAFT_572027 [Choanephora cucurbitarum]|nr:hypothetical protein EDC96DRAFT_572027 [Choanephora cucurbitarum]
MSVDDILTAYNDNSQLFDHILIAKAEEDKKKTAEEMRQAEEARLQTKLIEYEMNQNQDTQLDQEASLILDRFISEHNQAHPSLFESSFIDQSSQFAEPSYSLHSTRPSSPLPIKQSEVHYSAKGNASVSSSSPSMDMVSPNQFDMYSYENGRGFMSCSPPDMDMPLFSPTLATAPIVPSNGPLHQLKRKNSTSSTTSSKKSPRSSPKTRYAASPARKGAHRTLSYETVLNLGDLNINKNENKSKQASGSPPTAQPLDHEKVMEALRAKLRRSASPYQGSSRRKPSPEPIPPPNTYPTTGVLLLNLKNRRSKSSSSKRNNNDNNGPENS